MKNNGWKGFICARCGRFSKSVHLHHIQELVHGGENIPENLIPLCGDCHRELDFYPDNYPLEQFLVTMPGMILSLSTEMATFKGAELFSTRRWMALCASTYRAVNLVKAGRELESEGWTANDFMYAQNIFFCKYPYSDERWRSEQLKQVYGGYAPDLCGIGADLK
jgi:hypothetical protein